MKRFLLLPCLLTAPWLQGAPCATLFEHPGYQGAAWGIEAETESDNIDGAMIERRSWHGYIHGWHGHDRSWNDAISSVQVQPGCTLHIFTAAGFSETERIFDGVSSDQVPDNDAYSSFRCTCSQHSTNWGTILYLSAPLP